MQKSTTKFQGNGQFVGFHDFSKPGEIKFQCRIKDAIQNQEKGYVRLIVAPTLEHGREGSLISAFVFRDQFYKNMRGVSLELGDSVIIDGWISTKGYLKVNNIQNLSTAFRSLRPRRQY